MHKPIPFPVIGAFVVGALGLLIMGLIFFGSGKVFSSSHSYVMLFDQSVTGLYIQAPVRFRGVEVGSVERITLAGGKNNHPHIAVFVKLFESSSPKEFKATYDFSEPETVEDLIAQGLRAQLRSQSVLSGDLYLSLDMRPDESYTPLLPESTHLTEIPTVKGGLMEDFTANSLDISENLTGTLVELQQVLSKLDGKIDPLTDESMSTLKEMRKMFSTVTQFIEPTSPFGHQAPKTLTEVEKAAKAVRLLAEYIERNPSSILFGRSEVEVVDSQ